VRELQRFEVTPHEVVIGAGLTLSELEEHLTEALVAGTDLTLLRQLLPLFSSRLIRNRATLGGNLATASPIGDSSPALLALDAEVALTSASHGTRRVALDAFFLDYRKTALAPGEVIVSVHVPRPLARWQRFYKVSKRVLDDISTVAAAFALDLTADGHVRRLLIAFGGVAATPVRARVAEARAQGMPWNRETALALAAELETLGSPMTDQRGSAAYRRRMLGKLMEKFFADTEAEGGATT
jgi:xanthine dehydrogenase small subunit